MHWAFTPNAELPTLERTFFDMFVAEWRCQRGDMPMGSIAIVDDAPAAQYLAPEFELLRQMFRHYGLAARMYAGQTTNFRTPGGGFAPVVVVP